jgi:glycosyltransferase involved in cell wall biosynthesis
LKVLIEQQVITPYRLPFFKKLAEKVDLMVVASQNGKVDGVTTIDNFNEEGVVWLPEKLIRGRHRFHSGITDFLSEHQRDVYISIPDFFIAYGASSKLRKRLRNTGVNILWWGCDGYQERNFGKAKIDRRWLKRLKNPLKWHQFFLGDPLSKAMWLPDGFLAYSTYTSIYWQKVWDIPENKITVASNAIDTSDLFTYSQKYRDENPSVPNSILFVGRLTPGKRVDLLIKAFRTIKNKIPDAKLTIVGDGPDKIKLQSLMKHLVLEDIRFTGEITKPSDLAFLMTQSVLFVMPGLGGLGINSAMACGLPIVCTTADGTEQDLVIEGENGRFFKCGDKKSLSEVVLEVLANPGQLKEYGEKSEWLIRTRFTLDNMVNAFLKRIYLV